MIDALRCAVNIQLATTEREAGRPAERRIAYRIGINLGDIIGEGDDIFGEGVNIESTKSRMAVRIDGQITGS